MWYDVRRSSERDLTYIRDQLFKMFFEQQRRYVDETQYPQVAMNQQQILHYT